MTRGSTNRSAATPWALAFCLPMMAHSIHNINGHSTKTRGLQDETGIPTLGPTTTFPTLTPTTSIPTWNPTEGEPEPTTFDTTLSEPPQPSLPEPVADATPPACPETLDGIITTPDSAVLYYAMVPSNPPGANNGILCARLEVEGDSWVAFGISEAGQMIGSDAIIGLPDENTVLKYDLEGKSTNLVVAMEEDKQTLMDSGIVQEGGLTIMEFTKLLIEEGEIPILEEGTNNFLFSRGSGNDLGYHSTRVSFTKDFSEDSPTTTTPATTTGTVANETTANATTSVATTSVATAANIMTTAPSSKPTESPTTATPTGFYQPPSPSSACTHGKRLLFGVTTMFMSLLFLV